MILKPGQKLVALYAGWRRGDVSDPIDCTVKTVGRAWVTLTDGSRFAIPEDPTGPWELDGGLYSSPGNVFPSYDAWSVWSTRTQLWDRLRVLMRARDTAPSDIPLDVLRNFTQALEETLCP